MYEWLPAILGKKRFDREVGRYSGYDASQNPSISDHFAAAFFRFGHTLIPDAFNYQKDGTAQSLSLKDAFFNTGIAAKEPGVLDALLIGEVSQNAEEMDVFMADAARDDLFQEKRDLLALNIGRGRDHALLGYGPMRRALGLSAIADFDNPIFNEAPAGTVQALKALYETPDRCDLFVCMLAEKKHGGGQVGELLGHVLAVEYKRMRAGDQMWFENKDIWKGKFVRQIRKRNLASVFRANINAKVRGPNTIPTSNKRNKGRTVKAANMFRVKNFQP